MIIPSEKDGLDDYPLLVMWVGLDYIVPCLEGQRACDAAELLSSSSIT